MQMRKLLMLGRGLLAGALVLPVHDAFAKGGINNTVVSIAPGTVATGGGGGGGGGQRPNYIVFGFATTDAANAALAANPGLVGLTPDPNSLLLPVQIIFNGPPRP
jgi:hypothetical protein